MSRFNEAYDLKIVAKYLAWIVVCAILMMVSKGVAAILFPLIALGFLFQNKSVKLLFVLLLMVTATVGTSYFFKKGIVFAITVRSTLFALAFLVSLRIAGRKSSRFTTPLLGIVPYLLWECASSSQGWSPVISYLKIVLFFAIYFAYYSIANEVINSRGIDVREMRSMVLAVVAFFIIGSFVLIPFPGISQMNASDFTDPQQALTALSLFKGMTMHSQSLGPIVAAFATLVFGDLVFSIKKWDKLYVALLIISPILIYKTSSRTAMGTYLAGFMMVLWFAMQARGLGARWKGKVLSVTWLIVILALVAVLAIPQVQRGVFQFALKFGHADIKTEVSMEEMMSTRQGLMNQEMENYHRKPWIGNGFQVSEEVMLAEKESIKDYLTAPVEKGVWVTAVLEEGGLPGFLLFTGFILSTIVILAKRRAYISVAVFMTLVVSNLGEFTFFSMSYTGGMIWVLVFVATILDAQRLRQQNTPMIGRLY